MSVSRVLEWAIQGHDVASGHREAEAIHPHNRSGTSFSITHLRLRSTGAKSLLPRRRHSEAISKPTTRAGIVLGCLVVREHRRPAQGSRSSACPTVALRSDHDQEAV